MYVNISKWICIIGFVFNFVLHPRLYDDLEGVEIATKLCVYHDLKFYYAKKKL